MRISDWSSDVCSSDLQHRLEEVESLALVLDQRIALAIGAKLHALAQVVEREQMVLPLAVQHQQQDLLFQAAHDLRAEVGGLRRHALLHRRGDTLRSEEHTSELQSLMRISYAVFCLKKK